MHLGVYISCTGYVTRVCFLMHIEFFFYGRQIYVVERFIANYPMLINWYWFLELVRDFLWGNMLETLFCLYFWILKLLLIFKYNIYKTFELIPIKWMIFLENESLVIALFYREIICTLESCPPLLFINEKNPSYLSLKIKLIDL